MIQGTEKHTKEGKELTLRYHQVDGFQNNDPGRFIGSAPIEPRVLHPKFSHGDDEVVRSGVILDEISRRPRH